MHALIATVSYLRVFIQVLNLAFLAALIDPAIEDDHNDIIVALNSYSYNVLLLFPKKMIYSNYFKLILIQATLSKLFQGIIADIYGAQFKEHEGGSYRTSVLK